MTRRTLPAFGRTWPATRSPKWNGPPVVAWRQTPRTRTQAFHASAAPPCGLSLVFPAKPSRASLRLEDLPDELIGEPPETRKAQELQLPSLRPFHLWRPA